MQLRAVEPDAASTSPADCHATTAFRAVARPGGPRQGAIYTKADGGASIDRAVAADGGANPCTRTMSSSKRPAQMDGEHVVPSGRRTGKQAKVVRPSPPPVPTDDSGGSADSAADERDNSVDGSSESGGELESSDDPDKVAYNQPGKAGRAKAVVPAYIPSITCTTGDAVLRAAVVHAVLALGEYKVWSAGRHNGRSEETVQDIANIPAVFVVGQRPRRFVRLLLEGVLDIDAREFVQLVEGAGGVFGNRDATVTVLGITYSPEAHVRMGSVQYVNQRWLPDSIARWSLQPYSAYSVK